MKSKCGAVDQTIKKKDMRFNPYHARTMGTICTINWRSLEKYIPDTKIKDFQDHRIFFFFNFFKAP